MLVNVFYNYYIPLDEIRKHEIDYCFTQIVEDENIDTIFVLVQPEHLESMNLLIKEEYLYKINTIINDLRPTFKYVVYGALGENSQDDDINIFLNSDCFFGKDTDWNFIRNMSFNDRFSLSRYEVTSVNPIITSNTSNDGKIYPRQDSQDCWIFKGKPNQGMDIDFRFGTPGCDNRFSYELAVGGYNVTGPVSKIHVLHYHKSNIRTYSSNDYVHGNYKLVDIS